MKNDFYLQLEEAIEVLDIKGWVSQYCATRSVRDSLFRINCPVCGNSKQKLYVDTNKKLWFCQRCEFGRGKSNICILLAEISGRSIKDIQLEILSSFTSSVPEDILEILKEKDRNNKEIVKTLELLEYKEVLGTDNNKSLLFNSAKKYLYSRGLDIEDVSRHAIKAGLSLNGFTGPFSIFPIIYKDTCVGYQGRRLFSDVEPKYVSCSNISDLLYPIDNKALSFYEDKGIVFLVEGIFDALSLHKLGFPGLCTFGKKLTQLKLLELLNIKKICFAWDPDALKEIENISDLISSMFEEVLIVDLSNPPKNIKKADPGSAITNIIVKDWLINRLTNPIVFGSDEYFMWKLRIRLN